MGFYKCSLLGICTVFLASCILSVECSISLIDSGRTFESRPDRRVGQRLWKGYEYMGRLQYIPENPTLCPQGFDAQKKFSIVKPEDGLPVALIVSSGECSLMAKALVASNMIDPPNVVQYLIIKDHSKRGQRLGSGDAEFEEGDNEEDDQFSIDNELSSHDEFVFLAGGSAELSSSSDSQFILPKSVNYSREGETDDTNDDESYAIQRSLFHSERRLEGERILSQAMEPTLQTNTTVDNNVQSNRSGEGIRGEGIQVAILHVSGKVGMTLLDVISKEKRSVRESGGTKILLNGKQPSAGARTVLLWMLTSLIMCAAACCCMLLLVQAGSEVEQQPAPSQPVRRRLTLEQVRSRFPAFHFNPEEHHQQTDSEQTNPYCQLLDECTICLDEFHAGVRCRQLPCQHVFHSTCIARWLIERSAVCPLCKLDLFEEEEEEDSATEEPENPEPSSTRSLLRWWTRSIESTSNNAAERPEVEVPSAAPTTEATARSGEEMETAATDAAVETRSWWPFSVETGPLAEEEQHRSPRASNWRWTWFGPRRRDFSTRGTTTELTEPLLSSPLHSDETPQSLRESPLPPPLSNSRDQSESSRSTEARAEV
mmetsp:Transcript_23519/g.38322  ORF Transcript_23519/g.38322 Transcript_23519/m.38322 type:complete len:598 (+) Transcript_23519:173-1966(+)